MCAGSAAGWLGPVSLSDLLVVLATLVSAFGGAWLGHRLAQKADLKRDRVRDQSLARALLVEVEHNANLAAIYFTQNIIAPAYRMRHEVFDSAFPILVAGQLDADDVGALLRFYSQIEIVNWGLDEVDRANKKSDEETVRRERKRLLAKAEEMKSPESRFYSPAVAALKKHTGEP
jgi:hypothetical protein